MPISARRRIPQARTGFDLPFGPDEVYSLFTGIEVPDPITFVISPDYLNRGNLYPRQATLIKVIFLREDLFTPYDYDVVEEWEQSYKETGYNGIVPNILERMRFLRALGYKWFREVLLVMGRRAGKGHVTALAMAYVLWNYMAKGDPQGYYGIDRDKRLAALVFAGKRDQAKATVFGDLVNVITSPDAACFAPYISQIQTERLSIYAPHDFVRMKKMADKGMRSERDMATFEILPKESTPMAGRGPTSFSQAYDEMAHVVASGANRGADEVYEAAKPSLDQFGKDAFIVEPSSPWQMMGKFFENWQRCLAFDEETGEPLFPTMMMIQLASWEIYLDWERAHLTPIFPEGYEGDLKEYKDLEEPLRFQPLRGAIQVFDEAMAQEERANPDTFAVERRSKWATALDAYLNETKVLQVFQPWEGRLPENGPAWLSMQTGGLLARSYKAHGDPSKSNKNFGFSLAHVERGADGRPHVVFDRLHHWRPQDFADGIVDYEEIENWIFDEIVLKFHPDEITFDQFNSVRSIQGLQKRIRGAQLPKRVTLHEKTATRANNWSRFEQLKTAINLGLVHAPQYEQAELELRFLTEKNGVVDHPTSGPVQTKDVADTMMEVVSYLIGDQLDQMVFGDLSNIRPGGSQPGGFDTFPGMRQGGPGGGEMSEMFSGTRRAKDRSVPRSWGRRR